MRNETRKPAWNIGNDAFLDQRIKDKQPDEITYLMLDEFQQKFIVLLIIFRWNKPGSFPYLSVSRRIICRINLFTK